MTLISWSSAAYEYDSLWPKGQIYGLAQSLIQWTWMVNLQTFFPHSLLKVADEVSLIVTVPFPFLHPTIDSILIGLPLICFLVLFPLQTSPLRFPGNTSAMGCSHGRQSGYFANTQNERWGIYDCCRSLEVFEDICVAVGLQSSLQLMIFFQTVWFKYHNLIMKIYLPVMKQ